MAKKGLNQIKSVELGTTGQKKKGNKRQCGLCGGTNNLIKTNCCDNWICDDEDQYSVIFICS